MTVTTAAAGLPMPLVKPRPARPMPIRMTPLIDVVFILLVFFMVTSYLLPTDYLELDNRTSQQSTSDGDPLPELTLTDSGRVQWQDRDWALNELIPRLRSDGIRDVRLGTTPDTALNDFTQALTRLNDGGIQAQWKRNAPEPRSDR